MSLLWDTASALFGGDAEPCRSLSRLGWCCRAPRLSWRWLELGSSGLFPFLLQHVCKPHPRCSTAPLRGDSVGKIPAVRTRLPKIRWAMSSAAASHGQDSQAHTCLGSALEWSGAHAAHQWTKAHRNLPGMSTNWRGEKPMAAHSLAPVSRVSAPATSSGVRQHRWHLLRSSCPWGHPVPGGLLAPLCCAGRAAPRCWGQCCSVVVCSAVFLTFASI